MNELLKALLGNIDGGIEEVKDGKVFDLKTKEGHDEAVKSLNEVLKMFDKNPIFDINRTFSFGSAQMGISFL